MNLQKKYDILTALLELLNTNINAKDRIKYKSFILSKNENFTL